MGNKMKNCVIFAGGDFQADGFAMPPADLIICADGGLKHALEVGVKPDAVIGDFDSWKGGFPENSEIIKSPPEKDDTDTMLAVRYAIGKNCKSITLYGGLGGRFDHAFANVQTLIFAYENGCYMEIVGDGNILNVQGTGSQTYERRGMRYFSVFSLTEELHISELSGVKYPVSDYIFSQSFPLGVSNEITAEKACVSIKNGLALIICSERMHENSPR
ncbi:MAG: thiamine diphosphokinase [Ruminococcus sp.]|nr:thiamine diphosphokinase [Ruminococcus sp.]